MEKLKRLREERGLSQVKLAARADLNPATVNQIERGMRDASPGTLRKLADALEVSLYDLLEEEVPKGPAPLPLNLSAAGPEDEEPQRRVLPYVRPWFVLWNSLSERWQAAAKRGTLTVAAAQEADETHKNVMAAMDMVLHQLGSEGIDWKTGPIGDGLGDAMRRLASARIAMADASLQHLAESPLAQARIGKRKAERPQADLEEQAKREAR